MLRRTALLILGFLVTAAAGLFAADRMGVDLPWNVASISDLGSTKGDSPSTAEISSEKVAPAQTSPATEQSAAETATEAETALEETVAALSDKGSESGDPAPGSVALDISRVSPDGPSVFAGTAEPGAYITVFEDGKPAGTVRADDGGSWSLSTEHKFASADPNLSFKAASSPPPKAEAKPAPEAPAEKAEQKADHDTHAHDHAAHEQPVEDATSAPAVAGDVMRKFEDLVTEAREDAAREKASQEEAERQREAARQDAERKEAAAREQKQREAAETAKADTPAQEPERETTVAAASTPPKETQPAEKEAEAEKPAASSETQASASADALPAAKSTVDADAEKKSDETKTAMVSVPPKSAQPEAQAAIPVPIMFFYNQPTLTPEGERAAELLLEYLLLKRLDAIELTGHADERGTHTYNFDLSRQRLEAVAQRLKDGGYKGKLKLTPKGKTEPFQGIDRKKYRGEALYQFDRRVELRVTR